MHTVTQLPVKPADPRWPERPLIDAEFLAALRTGEAMLGLPPENWPA